MKQSEGKVSRFMWKDGVGVSGQDAVLPFWIRFHLNREMRSVAERNKNQRTEEGRTESVYFRE